MALDKKHSPQALEIISRLNNSLETALQSMSDMNVHSSKLKDIGYDMPIFFSEVTYFGGGVNDSLSSKDDLEEALDNHSPARDITRVLSSKQKLRLETINRLGEVCKWTCVYCQKAGNEKEGPDGRVWHLDHGYPRALGGDDDPENMILSCATCNIRKGKKTVTEVLRMVLTGASK